MRFEYIKKRIGIRWYPKKKIFGRDAFEICIFPPKGLKWYYSILPYTMKENDKGKGNE